MSRLYRYEHISVSWRSWSRSCTVEDRLVLRTVWAFLNWFPFPTKAIKGQFRYTSHSAELGHTSCRPSVRSYTLLYHNLGTLGNCNHSWLGNTRRSNGYFLGETLVIYDGYFWGNTSAILEFYFRFWSRPFCCNRRVILQPAAEFRPNRNIHHWNMTSYRFSRWRPSAILYLLWGNGGPPTKCLSWSEFRPQIATLSD